MPKSPRRRPALPSDERPETLWILHRPPDSKGPLESRRAWELLARAAARGRPRVMVEAPPASWSALQGELSGRGVSLGLGWSCDEEGFRASLRKEIQSRAFSAIFVVGADAVRRWLPWARLTAPGVRVVAVLTTERDLEGLRGSGAAARRKLLEATRRALAQADAAWCVDGRTLRAARAFLRGAPSPRPALVPPDRVWLPRPASPRTELIEAIVMEGADERGAAQALKQASPGRSRLRRVRTRGEGIVAALNKALFSARAPLLWVCLDEFHAPDAALLGVLMEGLAARPFAGGAIPHSPTSVAGCGAVHFRAAWAISRKGDWHEAGLQAHCCCLLLRRDALRAAGALDERLLGVDAALIDLALRLTLTGRPLFEARDALVGRPDRPAAIDAADRELLAAKWGSGALRLLESLVTALEPRDYRADPTVRAGFQGVA